MVVNDVEPSWREVEIGGGKKVDRVMTGVE